MGVNINVDYDKFPEQGRWKGLRTEVIFRHQDKIIMGTIVRDDMQEPFETIIQLDDGRIIRSTECQYSPVA